MLIQWRASSQWVLSMSSPSNDATDAEVSPRLLAGVLPGEVVASKGSAVLQAALLKGKLGEG